MKLCPFATAAAAACVAMMLSAASASPKFVSRIPNGANVPNVPAVGHLDPEGSDGQLNAFGTAFHKAGNKWTVALCQADSDGDGQTNGQELGDPCCVWTTDTTPFRVTGLSDPGVKTSVADASLWKSLDCETGGSTAATTTTAPDATSPAPATSTKASSGSGSSTPTATESSTPSSSSNSTSTTKSSSSPSVAVPSPSPTTTKSNSTTPSSTTKTPTATPAATSAASGNSFSVTTLALISGFAIGAIGAGRD
ncbi:hypothetical protein FI667_g7230, partial [Globisporangium splendens]